MHTFMVVTKQQDVVDLFRRALSAKGSIINRTTKEEALTALRKKRSDIIFIELKTLTNNVEKLSIEDILKPFKELYPTIDIVVMIDSGELDKATGTVKTDICNFLTYPISSDEIRIVLESVITRRLRKSELEYLREQSWQFETEDVVRTCCANVQETFNKAHSVAPTKTTVLLSGETGSGKGVLAKLIHLHSNRKKFQFISVHCGSIPDTLLESELFGHEKGAFTGAIRRKLGKFEIASGGTIFLDEIGTITPSAQIKLLQVLQDGSFSRVGGENVLCSDARVIAATNSDLQQMARDGLFRNDLFYRLNVFPIEIPPLRERIEDIPIFIDVFLKKLEKTYRKGITMVHERVVEALKHYSWPGNIRELENLIERAYIIETSAILLPKSFPIELFSANKPSAILPIDDSVPLADARKKAVEAFELQYLKKLLARHEGKIKKSANEAGISMRQLHKLLSKYGIHKEEYKK